MSGLVISPPLLANKALILNGLQQQQEQREIEPFQEARLESLNETRESLEKLVPLPPESAQAPIDEEACFYISQVRLEGNTLLTDDVIVELTSPFEERCLGAQGINQILKVLTNTYVRKGFVTTRAVLEPQDLSSGTLTIRIIEGVLGSMMVNGEHSDAFVRALPAMEGSILNLRDIEQALEQINRLPRYNAKILPK